MPFGADRTVKVSLKANVSDYIGKVTAAGKATQDFGKDAVKHAEKHRQAWQTTGVAMMGVGLAIGAGVGLAVKAFADFDKEMSNVRAVSGASASEMSALSAAAIRAGADTKFSASEAAKATSELAKAGVSTADILGGALKGSLDLAAAGNLDLAQAATISGQAMNLFKLSGKDVPKIADALANGANKSAADVADLGMALSQAGLVAAQTGLSLNDTVGVLSAFADRALLGSDAGTSLKTMLQRLNPQSKEAANLMDELGLRAYDANGQFIGMEAFAQKLKVTLGGMSAEQRNAAMQTLFGADAVRGANVLYELGAKGVHNYVAAISEQGAAARVAAIQLDNLAGDIETLKGSFETVLIQGGKGANDELRSMVQNVTSLINAYGSLPAPVQQGVVAFASLLAVTLLVGGAFVTVVPKVAATKAALLELTGSATAARTALSGLMKAAGLVAAAFAVVELEKWAARASVATVETKALSRSLMQASDNAGAFSDLMQGSGFGARKEILSTKEALDKFALSAQTAFGENWGDRIDRLTNGGAAVDRFGKQVGQIDKALADMVASGNIDGAIDMYDELMQAIDAANKSGAGIDVDTVRAKFIDYQAALDGVTGAGEDATTMQGGLSAAVAAGGETAEDAREKIDELIQSLASAGLVQLSARDAARQWEQSLDDLTDSVDKNGKTLDITTQAGRDNQKALDDVAQAAINQAQAIYAASGNENQFRDSLLGSRDALIASYRQLDDNQERAEAYADAVLNVPAVRATTFTTNAPAAIDEVRLLASEIRNLPNGNVSIRRTYTGDAQTRAGASVMSASGGYIAGPGTSTSDSIPAYLSNGEYVINAAATRQNRALLDAINSGRSVRAFANGGPVSSAAVTPAAASLAGLAIEGTLDLGNGLVGMMRGVVRGELRDQAHDLAGRR